MLFSPNKEFNEREIKLVKNVLEKCIGKEEEACLKKAKDTGFILLDHWNGKMGFVKEDGNEYQILSLHFKNSECIFYQLIIKKGGEKWSDGRIIDYNIVREADIVPNEKNDG